MKAYLSRLILLGATFALLLICIYRTTSPG